MKHTPIARTAVTATPLSVTAFNAAAQQDNSAVLQRLAALEARVARLKASPSLHPPHARHGKTPRNGGTCAMAWPRRRPLTCLGRKLGVIADRME
ncbi:MAG: hypothetical protein J0I01_06570 [Stenotrophomonas nitritireducens]|uniref:hypothetical protein n=1 Tax=Stenotrophomonas nitritireducens TaxID=83617 RepID=UPI001AC6813E|nr:hypothetical protein [Stenotrophomonas nitritireducens]MBN8791876.1 hypothetical protein [Stenotrophomonas nitritireducens]MBN8795812.1 hypothetical protein [Stenotrophomonas nitritireducens]